jgi:3D (Asp-Asp-Asp) domain-containing protein/peptidoglycan hydrolase CwlO-like protein
VLVRARCHQCPARLAVFCLAAIGVLAPATWARADDPSVHDQVAGLRSANANLVSSSQLALLELYSLETRLDQAERRITALEARSAEVENQRETARKALAVARSGFDTAQAQLAARLRQLYIEGDVDPLAVLLGAQSLDEVISALDGLDRLATQDKDIIDQLTRAEAALKTASARLAARQSELQTLLADARATRASIAAARDARAAYLTQLRHQQELNQAQIAHLTAQAAEASHQSAELTDTGGGGGTTVPPAPPADGTKMTVSSTGYCLTGNTATGVPTSKGVVAVDPAVIPLGTRMYVPGYGEGVAADTGSAVKGKMIDVWFSSCADAMAWGWKTVTITLH